MLAAVLFVRSFIPETKNRSERQNRELFWPGTEYGRILKGKEECKASLELQPINERRNPEFQLQKCS